MQKINKDELQSAALQDEVVTFDQKVEAYFKNEYIWDTKDHEPNLYMPDFEIVSR